MQPADPYLFQLGPLGLRWYGVLIMLAALAGGYVATLEAGRRGENPDRVWDMLIWGLVGGFIGARLYHVVSNPAGTPVGLQYYLNNPTQIFAIWQGGLGIYGGILGGLVAVLLYTRRHRLNLPRWLDIAAPALLLGQAIGRWGNFFNQELYGNPTDLPWGIPIAMAHRLPQFQSLPPDTTFHPTFLYESIAALGGFLLLIWISRRLGDSLRDGDMALLYLLIYPTIRFFTEMQRPDAWTILGIPTAQWIALLLIALATGLLIYRHYGISGPSARTSGPQAKTREAS